VDNWSIDDLLGDENTSYRRIKAITIESRDSQYEILLKIGDKERIKDQDQFVPTVSLVVSGPDRQSVFVVQSLIEDRIKSLRMDRPASWVILMSSLVGFMIFLTLTLVLAPYFPKALTAYNPATNTVQLKAIVLLPLITVGMSLVLATYWLFPDLEFLLGKGIERHQRLKTLKTNLFWSILVGGGVTIGGGYVAARFF